VGTLKTEVMGKIATLLGFTGTDFYAVKVDTSGHLQVDVLTVADLRTALHSVNTDELVVRGENQLFSFYGMLANQRSATISGAGGYVDSNSPATGEIWVVTNIIAINYTAATTTHGYSVWVNEQLTGFHRQTEAFGIGVHSMWNGHLYLTKPAVVRVYFVGATAGNTCQVHLTGYVMTKES